MGEFYQTFQRRSTILLKLFKNLETEEALPNSPYETTIMLIPKPGKDTTTTKSIGQYARSTYIQIGQ